VNHDETAGVTEAVTDPVTRVAAVFGCEASENAGDICHAPSDARALTKRLSDLFHRRIYRNRWRRVWPVIAVGLALKVGKLVAAAVTPGGDVDLVRADAGQTLVQFVGGAR
jgi:hypothetical protein